MIFQDRHDAGQKLAHALEKYRGGADLLVVGLARGGVVVAYEVAHLLEVPLEVLVVRKIGAPDNEELAIGAISETGEVLWNTDLIAMTGASSSYIKKIQEKERSLAEERARLYRKKKPVSFKNKTVILVDDGIATGASVEVAIQSLRKAEVKKIVLAAPVAAPDSLGRLKKQVDEVVCLCAPLQFGAVGAFYREFDQTSDDEVVQLLSSG